MAEDGPAPASAPAPEAATVDREALRMAEAILFASAEPLDEDTLAARLPAGADVPGLVAALAADYATRGVNLVRVAGKWMFRTAEDLAWLMSREAHETRRLPRAGLETLATIAYHQPVTRAEIEAIRGVSMSKGTLDVLLEAGWIRMRGRRRTPGRPITYGTTEAFLVHFGLESIQDLPGLDELRGAGLIEGHVPPGFHVPVPGDPEGLGEDEDPIDEAELADLFEAEEGGGVPPEDEE
ncbi:SMC-Scp complex subunit ScpB [Prosthecomicrobium sp. N25]|uniref:SMC-Scp complex subunit ScpB n=1 Tax=Prosthecomicrobium sp. N25 TaxID=3129254 RepID=UPI003077D1F3